jgi:RNA polymerase sigma-70 factor (ECF subfamily)
LRLEVRRLQLDPRLKRLWDSSDIAQDVYCKALEKFDQFEGESEGELVRWLQRILKNLVIDKIREAHADKCDINRVQAIEEALTESRGRLDEMLAARQSSPSEQAIRHERLLQLAKALEQLPKDQGDVIICHTLNRMPVKAIAVQLGKTERAVAMLHYHGMCGLRELLDGPDSKPV